jgi:hypothetical protein
LICRHGWQLAVIDAPTAISLKVRLSSFMVFRLLSDLIDGGRPERIHHGMKITLTPNLAHKTGQRGGEGRK